MVDVLHSGQSITGGHTNAVAAGAAGFLTGADKTKLDALVPATINGHISSTSNPHAVTAAQIGALPIRDTLATVKYDLVYKAKANITGVLPAYTITSGSFAAGTAVLTITAFGALPESLFGGVTLVTGDRVLVHYNDTNIAQAGLFDVVQGTGGSSATLTQTPGLNTAAVLQGSTVLVTGTGVLWTCLQDTIAALGTDPICWKPVGPISSRFGFQAQAVFSESGMFMGNNVNYPFNGWLASSFGSATSGITCGGFGVGGTFSTGSVSTGQARLLGCAVSTGVARTDIEAGFSWNIPVATDGVQTYTSFDGFSFDASNFCQVMYGGTLSPTVGAALTLNTTTAGVAGASVALGTFALNTDYRLVLRKLFGTTVFKVYFDPGTGVLGYVGDTPSLPATLAASVTMIKSLGVTARTKIVKKVWVNYFDPKVIGV